MKNKLNYFILFVFLLSSCVNIRLRTANENYLLSAYAPAVDDYEYVLSKDFNRDAEIGRAHV